MTKKMVSERDFFTAENAVRGVTEADYGRAATLVEAVRAFARSTYQCVYVIDYFREGFMYVSENLPFLCGERTEDIMRGGYAMYIRHVPEEEQRMLLEVNHAGFKMFERLPVEERLEWSISYDFHVTGEGHGRLINHKLTPLMLNGEGRMWLALCTMSVSSRKAAGNVTMRRYGSDRYWAYSLADHRWEERTEERLTDVERSVLLLSAQGFTMAEIAARLCRSVDAIKSCKRLLFARLGVGSISEAIAYAANLRLL